MVELEWRDGNRSIADGGVIGVRVNSFGELLFVQPVKSAPARVGAGLKQVSGDLGRLARKSHGSVPGLRHVDV